jgi:hypothetical protein
MLRALVENARKITVFYWSSKIFMEKGWKIKRM